MSPITYLTLISMSQYALALVIILPACSKRYHAWCDEVLDYPDLLGVHLRACLLMATYATANFVCACVCLIPG